jgi:hypothetical protein
MLFTCILFVYSYTYRNNMFSVEHASNFEARPHIIWIPHDLDDEVIIFSRFLPKE